MTSPVILADLIRDDKLLWVYCTDCGHERDVTPSTVPTARGDASARRE